jgi:hypothetical protein
MLVSLEHGLEVSKAFLRSPFVVFCGFQELPETEKYLAFD